mmetsp:Transcript_27189/g.30080  ORF Transcript_27189/g.30080 Transcript_27189/m.30080 type:complete len:102 (+) Transcript_27189:2446-2751(+)
MVSKTVSRANFETIKLCHRLLLTTFSFLHFFFDYYSIRTTDRIQFTIIIRNWFIKSMSIFLCSTYGFGYGPPHSIRSIASYIIIIETILIYNTNLRRRRRR